MPIDATTPQSAGWWAASLIKDLGARQTRLNRLDNYFHGQHDLPHVGSNLQEAYRRFQKKARVNFAELVVEAVRERMSVLGFRTGAAKDELGDDSAWQIWQANSLDADSAMVHQAMLAMSDAYVIVGPVNDEIGAPLITPEDPRQVITAHDPTRRRKVLAALKAFRDDVAGNDRLYVYLPGQVWSATRAASTRWRGWSLNGFEWDTDEPSGLATKLVPVVRFANRPEMTGDPCGEFENSMDTLDRINFMVLQRLMIAATQAFKQRGIKGLPQRDAQGKEVDYSEVFSPGPGALWQLPDTADIWESSQTQTQDILNGAKADIQDLAATTRTPLFYLTPDAANGSAEGATTAKEGLIFKTLDRLTNAGESWEQVMSIAFQFAGDAERAARTDMEIIWESPQRYSLAERYAAAVQAVTAGVPWESRMVMLQFSPQEIERMRAEKAADALEETINPPEPTRITLAEAMAVPDPAAPAFVPGVSAPAPVPDGTKPPAPTKTGAPPPPGS